MKKGFKTFLFIIVMIMMTSCALVTKNDKAEIDPGKEKKAPEQETIVPEEKEEKKEVVVPVEKGEENLLPEMTKEEAREVNIFLSNLSEARYDPTSGYYSREEALIDFAFTHININASSKVVGEDYYMGIYASDADAVLKRFFGKTVPHETPENSKNWIYRNGKFLTPAAAGESYGDFSIATSVKLRKEGNYKVDFNVYTDVEIAGGNVITDKTIYSLTDSEAAEKYKLIARGIAVLKPKTHNGEETYEIVSYLVEDY